MTKKGNYGSGKQVKLYQVWGDDSHINAMLVMFGVMYLNTYQVSHVEWSETRLYMTLLMGATMAVVMLSFMLDMYKNMRINLAIYAGSVIVFLIALFLVRSQTLVGDTSYMRAMIPHHSIAILTSERAEIDDVRVRELADQIILTQLREIEMMNWLIEDIAENGVATTDAQGSSVFRGIAIVGGLGII